MLFIVYKKNRTIEKIVKKIEVNRLKKKILFVVDNLKMGGVTKVLENLLNYLEETKYDVDLLVLHDFVDMKVNLPKNVEKISGGKSFAFVDENIQKILKEKNISKLIQKALFAFRIKTGTIKKLIQKDRKENLKKSYDIEIAFGDGFPYLYTAYGDTSKKIAWMHSDVLVRDYSARYFQRMKQALSSMNACVAVSEKVANAYREKYEAPNVLVIPNLINQNEILEKSREEIKTEMDQNTLKFISVGRLDYSKNYDMLLRVSKRLKEEKFSFKVYIVGNGDERENLEKQIQEQNMEDTFILLGRKDNPYPYVKNSDLFLLSSRYEGLPTVVIEALILHVPCLATDVAGIGQIITPQIGVISKNAEEDFYQKWKEILKNPERIKEMKENLKDYQYDNESILQKIQELFDKI